LAGTLDPLVNAAPARVIKVPAEVRGECPNSNPTRISLPSSLPATLFCSDEARFRRRQDFGSVSIRNVGRTFHVSRDFSLITTSIGILIERLQNSRRPIRMSRVGPTSTRGTRGSNWEKIFTLSTKTLASPIPNTLLTISLYCPTRQRKRSVSIPSIPERQELLRSFRVHRLSLQPSRSNC